MRESPRRAALVFPLSLLVPLVACSGSPSAPDAPPIDAPPPDAGDPFGCLGKPLPVTAPAMITISGVAEEITANGSKALVDTNVKGYDAGNTELASTKTAGTTAAYSLSVATGGAPLDGYVVGTHEQGSAPTPYLDTYLYPPAPLAVDTGKARIVMFSKGIFDLAAGLATVNQAAGKGFLAIVVSDCNNTVLMGATVSTEPGGDIRYNGANAVPNPAAVATAKDGIGYVFNVPVGKVTVKASYNGMTLRAHDVMVRPDVVTTTVVQP
jgi:hypothetical protein